MKLETNKNTLKNTYIRFNKQEARQKLDDKELIIQKIKSNKAKKQEGVNYVVEMLGISKSFNNGKIVANDEIDLRVAKNEIHAIIGENGAGKSTLMSILFGIYQQDEGIIKINNKIVNFESAKDAAKVGLGMVHQHFKLVPTYTVFENIILGSEEIIPIIGMLKIKDARKKLKLIIKKYQLGIKLDTKISDLTVSQEQKVEILKLLFKDSNILIFDEPTAVLSPIEINQFLKIVIELRNQGKTIVIITHKFAEIKSIANRGTVIRLGRYISDFNIKDKTIEEMTEEMVGNKVEKIENHNHEFSDKVIIDIKNLNISKELTKNKNIIHKFINFSIRSGEIFAVAGVSGNGQTELALALSGLKTIPNSKIILLKKDISNMSINNRYKNGLSHVPEDRQKHGLLLDMPTYLNAVSNRISEKPFSKYGFLQDFNIKHYAKNLIKKYDVRGTFSGTTMSRSLSGGNQQKLIIAREISNQHKFIIMVQPTRGLDIGAIGYIHKKILEEKQKGNAVLLISYELDEILSLADTVAVINKGVFVDVSSIKNTSKQKIGELMIKKHTNTTVQKETVERMQ